VVLNQTEEFTAPLVTPTPITTDKIIITDKGKCTGCVRDRRLSIEEKLGSRLNGSMHIQHQHKKPNQQQHIK